MHIKYWTLQFPFDHPVLTQGGAMQNGTVGTVIQVNVDSMMFFYANAAKVKKKKQNKTGLMWKQGFT